MTEKQTYDRPEKYDRITKITASTVKQYTVIGVNEDEDMLVLRRQITEHDMFDYPEVVCISLKKFMAGETKYKPLRKSPIKIGRITDLDAYFAGKEEIQWAE